MRIVPTSGSAAPGVQQPATSNATSASAAIGATTLRVTYM
jgi:hypothetical protein